MELGNINPDSILVLVAIINGIFLLSGAAFTWWLNNKRKRKYDEDIGTDIWTQTTELEGHIIQLIRDLLEQLNADRICIYQLHNGEKFIHSSIHFKKITMYIEEVSDGIAKEIMNQQNIPVSTFYDILKKISLTSESDEFICEDLKLADCVGSNLKVFLLDKGVRSFYVFAIRDLIGRVIGLLKVTYIKKKVSLTNEQLDICRKAGIKLSGYLVE